MKNNILFQNIRLTYKNLNHFEVFLAQQETQPLAICLTPTQRGSKMTATSNVYRLFIS